MMLNRNPKKSIVISSFEDASILRKFTILFLLASIIPLGLLTYFYFQHHKLGHIEISDSSFKIAMIFMALGVLVGYYSMRSLMVKVIQITEKNRRILEKILNPEDIKRIKEEENEIEVLSRSFQAVTKRLEENIEHLENAKKTLQSVMAKVGQGISNMEKIDSFLNLILETLTNALNGKVSTIMILNDTNTELSIVNVWGAYYDPSFPLQIKLHHGSPLLKVLESKKPEIISSVFIQDKTTSQAINYLGENCLCVPLIFKDKMRGILTIYRASEVEEPFNEEDINLVFHLASQTAVALENSKLNKDIEKTYLETISALALAVDAKDKYARGHLERVSKYCYMIGKQLGLDDTDLKLLKDASRLHDLGKIGIPDDILLKDKTLTDEEWVIMRRHPEIGESIIKPVRSLQPLCDMIRHHHEKLDGTGYPDRLKGDDISPLVRILTIADIYDALTTERSYRPRKSKSEAAQIMRSMKNEIDQDIVEVFLEALETKNSR